MAGRKRRVFRITGWIMGSFLALILLITLVFYLGRGWIMGRVVNHFNETYPGEIQMDQMNLIPLMNFPDVVLQLRNLSFNEYEENPDSLHQEDASAGLQLSAGDMRKMPSELRAFEPDLRAPLLRRAFRVARPVKRARAFVCGLGLFELLIEG